MIILIKTSLSYTLWKLTFSNPNYALSMWVLNCSVVSDSLQPHGLQPTRLLCPSGFSRQEYWSGLPCPPPGDLPDPGTEPRSPVLQANSLPTEPPGKHALSIRILKLLIYMFKNMHLKKFQSVYFYMEKVLSFNTKRYN